MLSVREITADDKEWISQWMQKDEHHKDFPLEMWYAPLTESRVFEDEEGPVMVLRIERALRLHMQFPPVENKRRIVRALPEVSNWISQEGRKAGFRQLIFDSVSKQLIRFCCKYLGFRPSPDEFVASL